MNEMHVCLLPVSGRSVHVSKSKTNTVWYKSQPWEFSSKPQSPETCSVGFLIPVIGKAFLEIVKLKWRHRKIHEASYFTCDRVIDYLNELHQLVWETRPQGRTKSGY